MLIDLDMLWVSDFNYKFGYKNDKINQMKASM